MSRSSNTPATPVSNPASAQGVDNGKPAQQDVQREIKRIQAAATFTGGDSEDLISYAKEVVRLRASPAPLRDAAVPVSGGVSIKPLPWNTPHPSTTFPSWHAQMPAFRIGYSIRTGEMQSRGQFALYADFGGGSHWVTGHDTIDEAKAAAQAGYEQRIRSALSSALTSGSEAGGEAVGWVGDLTLQRLKNGQDGKIYPHNPCPTAGLSMPVYLAKADSEPAGGGVFRERVKQVRYHWEVIQGQCSDGDGFTERAAMDLELAIDALEAALSSAPATPSPAEAEALPAGVEAVNCEVTEEMIEAGREAAERWTTRYLDGAEFVNWDDALPDIFRCMLEVSTLSASAPAPEERADG